MAFNCNCYFKNGVLKGTRSHTVNVVLSAKWCKVELVFATDH